MKVAHVLRKYDPRAWGGTETAVLELIKGLLAHGVESVVFAPELGERIDTPDPIAELGVPIRRFRAFLPVLGLSKAERARSLSVGGNIMSVQAPRLLMAEPGIDIVHSHALGRLGGLARLAARMRRLPFVVTIHGGYRDLPEHVRKDLAASTKQGFEYGKAFGWLVGARNVVETADAVITCNPREAELLGKQLPARRILRMPHGIPSDLYAVDHRETALARWPQLRGRRVLLCVGRIDAIKNQAFLVEHMPHVRSRFPDAILVLAGPETDAAHGSLVRNRVEALGLHDHVLLTGGVAPRDPALIGLYQSATLLVLPSLSETFGLVVLEAWASGTAVLATPTSGVKQLVVHRTNGCLFDLEDRAGFDREVDFLLTDEGQRNAMADRGRKLVKEKYDSVVVAAGFRKLYEDLSARHR